MGNTDQNIQQEAVVSKAGPLYAETANSRSSEVLLCYLLKMSVISRTYDSPVIPGRK